MAVPSSTADLYSTQRALQRKALAKARKLWAQMNPAQFDQSWQQVGPQLVLLLAAAQEQAANNGIDYIPVVLAELGIDAASAGAVSPQALAGVASSGYPLADVLANTVIEAKVLVQGGATGRQALRGARWLLDGIVVTQTADAGRVAEGVGIAAAKHVSGYIRMLNPPSCSRCVVLAGRFYRWNKGFERHPRCDCIHIPASEDMAGDYRTDPKAYFNSLTPTEQDQVFTRAGAQAIRDGADISQVVNARRGANGLTPAGARITADEARMLRSGRNIGRLQPETIYGRPVFATLEGTTRRGIAGKAILAQHGAMRNQGRQGLNSLRRRPQPPRLMPESIYQIAQNRDDAIRLLKLYGYLI